MIRFVGVYVVVIVAGVDVIMVFDDVIVVLT